LTRHPRRLFPARRRAGAVAAALLVAPGLVACGGPDLSSGEQGYVGGDGTVSVLATGDRKQPDGEVTGETIDGDAVSLADHDGRVVVMPVWGSWCAPCRAEAPMLAEAARDLEKQGVSFLGIDSRDENEAKARAFEERFDIPYPSIYDPDGITLLTFHGTLPPMTIPSFVFIDAEGRIAARVLGEIDRSTLYGVVSDVLGEEVRAPQEPA
jgi:thiol-disulfide isomerase/thioredoxin